MDVHRHARSLQHALSLQIHLGRPRRRFPVPLQVRHRTIIKHPLQLHNPSRRIERTLLQQRVQPHLVRRVPYRHHTRSHRVRKRPNVPRPALRPLPRRDHHPQRIVRHQSRPMTDRMRPRRPTRPRPTQPPVHLLIHQIPQLVPSPHTRQCPRCILRTRLHLHRNQRILVFKRNVWLQGVPCFFAQKSEVWVSPTPHHPPSGGTRPPSSHP